MRPRGLRLIADGVDPLLAREVEVLLALIEARVRAVTLIDVALLDLRRLLLRLLVAAAHEAGRHAVVVDEAEARVEQIRIELHGALELALRLRRQRRLAEQA